MYHTLYFSMNDISQYRACILSDVLHAGQQRNDIP